MSSIGKRMLLWIIILVIIPLGLISFIVYHRGKGIIKEQIYVSLKITADSAEAQLLELISDKENRVKDFSSDGFIMERLKKIHLNPARHELVSQLNDHLARNKKSLDKDILDIFIFDKNGRPVAGTNKERLKNGDIEPEYFQIGREHTAVVSMEAKYAKRHFGISAPLKDISTGDFIGVITVLFKASSVDNILTGRTVELRGARTIFGGINDKVRISIIDGNKTIVSSNVPGLIGRRADTSMVRRTLAGNEVAEEYTGALGEKRVGASMFIKEPGWAVVVSSSEDEMFAPLNNLSRTVVPFIFGGVIVILGITVTFTRKVTDRAHEAAAAAKRIADGNFSERIKISGGEDEFSRFASSFNEMSERLGESFDTLREREERVARLNMFYSALSSISEVIVRERDARKLYDEVCRICVNEGFFKDATVVLVDPATHAISAASYWRPMAGCPFQRHLSPEDIAEGDGPVSVAMREKRPSICNDLGAEPRAVKWRENALKCESRALGAFPLIIGGQAIGALCLCAGKADFFDDENVRLLGRITANISYAVEFIRREEERKWSEEAIRHLAYHDHLTGLPNRLLLIDHINQALSAARRQKVMAAVIFLDLDRFKIINDTLGHAAGDEFLKAVAERMKPHIRESDTVSRLGGDEFVILVQNIRREDDIIRIAEKILSVFKEPFSIRGQELFATCSLGISIYPGDGEDAETLLKNADVAMYRAKEEGRNNFQLYTSAMNERVSRTLTIEHKLRKAIEKEEFVVYYQPQVNIDTGEVIGVEALLRWLEPEKGIIPPGEFIPLAEDTGLIVPIGEWILRTACRQNKLWQDRGLKPMNMAINLSIRQLKQKNFLDVIEKVFVDTGLDPRYLELELTESIMMENVESNTDILHALKAMGIRLAIDDFGTGYSSLEYLKRLPIDRLKVAQSFVSDITTDPDDATIASTIIKMGRSLKMDVIAEGVETAEQLNLLRQMQCYKIQGHLVSRSLPPEEVEAFLQKEWRLAL